MRQRNWRDTGELYPAAASITTETILQRADDMDDEQSLLNEPKPQPDMAAGAMHDQDRTMTRQSVHASPTVQSTDE